MKKHTMQEWADFTGLYVVIQGNELPRQVYFYKEKPSIVIDNDGSHEFKHWFGHSTPAKYALHLDESMIQPFDGDWKDSLHSPKEEKS